MISILDILDIRYLDPWSKSHDPFSMETFYQSPKP